MIQKKTESDQAKRSKFITGFSFFSRPKKKEDFPLLVYVYTPPPVTRIVFLNATQPKLNKKNPKADLLYVCVVVYLYKLPFKKKKKKEK
jgi:hypothetical protein